MADTAGVSKPVLYSEFGDKLGMVDAVALVLAEQIEGTVIKTLAAEGTFGVENVLGAIVDALVTLIDGEPQLYAFLVKGIRTSDRGFLDNALVRVIHERAALIIGHFATEVRPDELAILTDGVFGFVFAVVESWLPTRQPSQPRLVQTISAVIEAGLIAVTTRTDGRPD
jgi:AcrR family transcriptional regulator